MKKTEFVTIKGKAYTCTETRTGPPLRYVAEKLRRCVEGLHSLHAETSGDPRCAINLLGPFR